MTRPEIHFHINPREAEKWRGRGRLAIFNRLAEMCDVHGLTYRAISRPWSEVSAQEAPGDGNLHIVENGRMRGEGWLNTGLAYLTGFWHLDPAGIQAESSARLARFAPDPSEAEAAAAFLARLQSTFSIPRLSRFHQARALADDLPQGAIALFLQGRSAYVGGRCRLPMTEMILGVCNAAAGRPVIIKPHPQRPEVAAGPLAAAVEAGATFHLTEANVHDVLAAAAVTVSVNSAAAIEGFLHGKPAILFGKSDFESLIVRASGPADFPQALDHALSADWDYAAMLHWYFSRHTVELAAQDFEDRAFAAFARVGFPRERFGL
jgi:hypothetical protein